MRARCPSKYSTSSFSDFGCFDFFVSKHPLATYPSNIQNVLSELQFTVYPDSFDTFAFKGHILSSFNLATDVFVTNYFANIYNSFNSPIFEVLEEEEEEEQKIVHGKIDMYNSNHNIIGDINTCDNSFDSEYPGGDLHTMDQGFFNSECSQTQSYLTPSSPLERFPSEENIHSVPKTKKKSFRSVSFNYKKEYKYVCKFCGKRFLRPSSLSTHVNTHTGDKPFICPYINCRKEFNARSNMTRHYKTHFKVSSGEYVLPSGEIVHKKPTLKQLNIPDS